MELVGSTVVGRPAPLAAAADVAAAANLVAGPAVCRGAVASGENSPVRCAFGLGLAGGGLVFAGVAAVAAQLTETARAANTLAVGALGAAFIAAQSATARRSGLWLG